MRKYAKEKLKHWLRVLLHTQDSPERTAMAFAVGVFIAFLPPVPWFHTLFALLIAFLFRLNRLAILAGTYTNTPFTILPLIGAEIGVGKLILKGEFPLGLPRHIPHSLEGWRRAFVQLRPFVPPLLLGSLLLGLVGAGIAYVVALRVVVAYRKRRALADAEEARAPAPASPPIPPGPSVDTPENPT